jgi:hypothetical protein
MKIKLSHINIHSYTPTLYVEYKTNLPCKHHQIENQFIHHPYDYIPLSFSNSWIPSLIIQAKLCAL